MTLRDDDALGGVEHVMSSHYTINVRAILRTNLESICALELQW